MRNLSRVLIIALISIGMAGAAVQAQDATELMKASHLAFYYAGDDGKSEVIMRIVDKKGKERIKEFTMLRLDIEDGGDQKYYTYFKKPSDVSRLTFMVHKAAESNDKRWIYVPSVDLIKPISADDKNSSFVGSDFSYEDVSGRHWTEDNHTLIGDSTLDGTEVYVIQSVPKKAYKAFARKVSYINKANMLPVKEEYFNKKDKLVKIMRAEKIEVVDGITTITSRSMEDVKKKRKTTVEFSRINYNVGLTDDIFTERYLKTPPRQFVK